MHLTSKNIFKREKYDDHEKSAVHLNSHRFERAERAYEKRMREGEGDFRVLVGKGVKVFTARKKIAARRCYFFEIEFEGNLSDDRLTGDLYLTRKNDIAQSAAVITATSEFYQFNRANGNFFSISKEYIVFDGRIRHPSAAIFPHFQRRETLNSTVLLEVEVEPRSLQAMHAYCLHYFRKPCVRAVLLFKFFPQHADNRRLFEAAAVLYRRGPRGAPIVADAVSFGTAAIPPDSLTDSLPDIRRALRVLPPAPPDPPGGAENPWAPALRPALTVPAEDLHFLGDGAGAGAKDDLLVDLWDMLTSVVGHEWPMVRDKGGRYTPRRLLRGPRAGGGAPGRGDGPEPAP